ncbi:rhodanese-like domain-containing protein [Vitreoscilla massiliensis]|uniref:Rhodanese-like domain-containing protein n=1 Tax=Vitreoscilla massiliensis TaxID=1689272 RepID=A0ABY4DY23_9NEIS|nr:rhodanese-like domain-containing protein [Vitreoscilla massiliensis]UOO88169.1 rhodanese-like domain-containing protein [Vitreoscilla massiliensis]
MSPVLQLKNKDFLEHHSNALPANGGEIHPLTAWQWLSDKQAILVDVRSAEERVFVGHVPGSLHVAWANGTKLNRNPRFVRELAAKADVNSVVFLLCRSGKRSALAAEEAVKAGFTQVYSIAEGFEGDLDASEQRGRFNGWRFHKLPWVQA